MKRSVLNFNRACFVKMAAICLFSLNTMLAFGQCAEVNPLEVPPTFQNGALDGGGYFNAIVFGNYNTGDGGGTAGRLAVGGNFTFNSTGGTYMVGVLDGSAVTSDNLIVEQTLSNIAGVIRVRGIANYTTLEGLSTAPIHSAGEGSNSFTGGLLNYSGLKTYYTTLSNTKKTTPALGTVGVSAGVVTLTGSGAIASYVFNVTLVGGELTDINYVNIPVGSEILINILNPIVSIAPSVGSVAMVNTHRPKTLFNFPNATQIFLSSFVLEGGILAPLADLSAQNSQVLGAAVIGGNILLANNFVFATGCIANPLPVTLSAFSVRREEVISNLSWETTSETAAQKFVIERSSTAKHWNIVGEVVAKGESKGSLTYSFADRSPLRGNNFYRLKMVDFDASFAYSRIVTVNFPEAERISIYPNPVGAELSITVAAELDITGLEILDQAGKTMLSKPFDGNNVNTGSWSSGLYLIRLSSGTGNITTHKIVKK